MLQADFSPPAVLPERLQKHAAGDRPGHPAQRHGIERRGSLISRSSNRQLFPRHLRVVELVSEIQGTFLVTSNTHGVDRLEPPPEASG